MSFIDTIRDALALPSRAASMAAPLESPFASPNHLMQVMVDDRLATGAITRATAMRVPTVSRCRRLIVGSIARLPLVATRDGEPLENQPRWLSRTDGELSPFHRMAWTIDDLLFYGWSLWAIRRDSDGTVIDADRVPYEMWSIDATGQVLYDGKPVSSREVCLIPSLDEGVLATGRDAISHAAELNRAAARAASIPTANIELHQTSGAPIPDDQIDALVSSWANARRGANGGVAFTNQAIEVREHGSFDAHLLVDGRNAAAVDVARAMGIPASMIDAQLPHASMTYRNAENMRNAEFVDFCLAPLMSAVIARLGMDDIVPRGVAIEFDTSDLTGVAYDETLDVPDDRNRHEA